MFQFRIVDAFDDVELVRQTFATCVEEIDFIVQDVVHAFEVFAHADRPGYGRAADLQDVFHFVQQFQRIAHFAVVFVHEGNNRRIAQAADVQEFDGLRFHAFCRVNDHQGAVDGGQNAVGVFGEVLVSRRVQEVDGVVFVVELHHGRGHGNAALLLDVHPVGGGEFAGFLAFYRTCALNRT